MSSSPRTIVRSDGAPSTLFLGLDVHKDFVTIAVLTSDAAVPTHVDRLSYDPKKLRRYLERLGPVASLRDALGQVTHLKVQRADAWPNLSRMSRFRSPVDCVQANPVRRRFVAKERPSGFQPRGTATRTPAYGACFIQFTITFSKPRTCESAT